MHILVIILELILADLILGGDNAVVIALATKNLEESLKKKASIIGALIAIVLRVIFITIILLLGEISINFLHIAAGLVLLYVALGLLTPETEEKDVKAGTDLFSSVKSIVIADAVMSFDNAIVIASISAKSGYGMPNELILVVGALLLSFPIILFGASILGNLLEKYKWILYICGFMLVHIALGLVIADPILKDTIASMPERLVSYGTLLISAIIVFLKVKSENKKA